MNTIISKDGTKGGGIAMWIERAIAPDPWVVIKADAGSAKVAAGARLTGVKMSASCRR